MKLLLAEDNSILQDGMSRSLQQGGYELDCTADGLEAERLLAANRYDLLILDLMLPGQDGLMVLRKLRATDTQTPVLIITARDSVGDCVTGLDLGADDYLTKPFDLAEFEARVRALVRRGQGGERGRQITIGELRLDSEGQRAYWAGTPLELTARELGLLEALMRRAGQVVKKEILVEKLSGWEEIGQNAIEVYVHRLRKKLEHAPVQIRTIRGLGYLLEKN
jgi:two-component system OmpR family response regulator